LIGQLFLEIGPGVDGPLEGGAPLQCVLGGIGIVPEPAPGGELIQPGALGLKCIEVKDDLGVREGAPPASRIFSITLP